MTNQYLIAIGSNLGDRLEWIRKATRQVETRCGSVTARSHLYATAPVGAANQEFLNGAFIVASSMAPAVLLRALLEIERELGRTREIHWGNRTIDLDIGLAGDDLGNPVAMDTHELKIPHPRMLDRDFVLVPAAEIAPTWIHPGTGIHLESECKRRFPAGLSRAHSVASWSD